MSNYDRIYTTVRQIPKGHVATYGQIADLAGLYGKARLVGYALFRVQIADDIPWHRVINAKEKYPILSSVKVVTICKRFY